MSQQTRARRWGPAFKTRTERLRRTITDLVDLCRSQRHQAVEEQRAALARRLVGHYNYFGVNGNDSSLQSLLHQVKRAWRKWLSRRGLDRADSRGNLNVSLFDVADMDHPKMLARAPFGPTRMYEDYMITSGAMAEDQDRIQKAFAISDDGLVAVPFSSGAACGAGGGGVQLLDWQGDTLVKRAFLPVAGHPRRAIRRSLELIAVSDSNVSSFSIARRDVATQTADLVIGACAANSPTYPGVGGGGNGRRPSHVGSYGGDGEPRHHNHCAVGAVGGASGSAGWSLGLVALYGLARVARRRR